MNNKKRNVWIWIVLAVATIVVLFIIFNWQAFASGFEAGQRLAD